MCVKRNVRGRAMLLDSTVYEIILYTGDIVYSKEELKCFTEFNLLIF